MWFGRPREVLPEIGRRPPLQRLVVLHHRLDTVRPQRASESFGICLLPGDHRHCDVALHEIAIHAQHLPGFHLRFVVRRMGCMALLPEKLGRTQEEPRAHLPADRSEEHTSELQSHSDLVCRLLLEKKKLKDRYLIYGITL